MKDYMYVGSSPYEEECAQSGTIGFHEVNRFQCGVLRDQLVREYKATHNGADVPDGCELATRREPGGNGGYYEVVANYDDSDEKGADAAFWMEANLPANWDREAHATLDVFYRDKGVRPDGSGRVI